MTSASVKSVHNAIDLLLKDGPYDIDRVVIVAQRGNDVTTYYNGTIQEAVYVLQRGNLVLLRKEL